MQSGKRCRIFPDYIRATRCRCTATCRARPVGAASAASFIAAEAAPRRLPVARMQSGKRCRIFPDYIRATRCRCTATCRARPVGAASAASFIAAEAAPRRLPVARMQSGERFWIFPDYIRATRCRCTATYRALPVGGASAASFIAAEAAPRRLPVARMQSGERFWIFPDYIRATRCRCTATYRALPVGGASAASFIAAEAAPTGGGVSYRSCRSGFSRECHRSPQARKRLGGTPLQRWKAWRKLAVSLKPSTSAMRYTGHCSSLSNALARSKRSSSSRP